MTAAEPTTRTSLLDAAELLITERGFARASVRAITEAANANVAAVNYHFGSKLELIKAVIERRIGPLNAERLRRLEACEAGGEVTLEAVVEAFVAPAIADARAESHRQRLARLLGMAFSQPSSELRAVMLQQFRPVIDRFVPVLIELLPDVSQEQIYWRVHFMIGALAFTIGLGDIVEAYSDGRCDASDMDSISRQLVEFLTAGFRYGTPGEDSR